MADMTEEKKGGKRGPRPGFRKKEPFHPERVLAMFKLHREGKSPSEIAREFGITIAGASHNIKRWAEWAEGRQ